jgi:hypothetical protein
MVSQERLKMCFLRKASASIGGSRVRLLKDQGPNVLLFSGVDKRAATADSEGRFREGLHLSIPVESPLGRKR